VSERAALAQIQSRPKTVNKSPRMLQSSEELTSVFSRTRRHFTISSKTISSDSTNFRLQVTYQLYVHVMIAEAYRLPPFPTSEARWVPSASIPRSSKTNCWIQVNLAVERCTRNEIRCFASRLSVGLLKKRLIPRVVQVSGSTVGILKLNPLLPSNTVHIPGRCLRFILVTSVCSGTRAFS
jgi:hypothetical protein